MRKHFHVNIVDLKYFIRDELRMKSKNVLYPPNVYKGMVWQQGGNNKLFYAGVQVLTCNEKYNKKETFACAGPILHLHHV